MSGPVGDALEGPKVPTVRVAGSTQAKPGGVNADAWGMAKDTAWVIDGATQPPGTECCDLTASQFSCLASGLLESMASKFEQNLVELTRNLILQLVAAHSSNHPSGEVPPGPAATLAIAHVAGDGSVSWLVLGDAGCAVGNRLIVDDRLATVAVDERQRRRAASPVERATASMRLFLAERAFRNQPDGYWVVADDPSAADHALTGLVRHGPVVLCSDGLHRGIGPGKVWEEPADLVSAVSAMGPDAAIAELRGAANERADVRPDDATVVIVE